MEMRRIELPQPQVRLWRQLLLDRRVLLVAAAVVAAGAALWWSYGRGPAVTTVLVARGSAAEIVYATGAIEPERWAKVTTLVKGRIIERCRCEGLAVKQGQVLARLDDAEAQATLRELKSREEYARRDVERQTQLLTRGFTSTQAYERALTELNSLQALVAAQTERLDYYRLTSPMDGTVLREDGEVGEVVDSNAILYRIGLPKPLQLVAEVNEEDIPKVRIGLTVLLRSDAFAGERLTGTVREITPAGDPIAKTYRIRVALPDDTPLRVGMSVEANVVTREKDNVLLVPAAAVVQNSVFVVQNSRAVRRPINAGIRGTNMIEVLSGIAEGETVISPAPSDLADGARVHVTRAAAAAKQ
jgi:RND family efflux transporter MFP subunit